MHTQHCEAWPTNIRHREKAVTWPLFRRGKTGRRDTPMQRLGTELLVIRLKSGALGKGLVSFYCPKVQSTVRGRALKEVLHPEVAVTSESGLKYMRWVWLPNARQGPANCTSYCIFQGVSGIYVLKSRGFFASWASGCESMTPLFLGALCLMCAVWGGGSRGA